MGLFGSDLPLSIPDPRTPPVTPPMRAPNGPPNIAPAAAPVAAPVRVPRSLFCGSTFGFASGIVPPNFVYLSLSAGENSAGVNLPVAVFNLPCTPFLSARTTEDLAGPLDPPERNPVPAL